jgi:hypothetical protein
LPIDITDLGKDSDPSAGVRTGTQQEMQEIAADLAETIDKGGAVGQGEPGLPPGRADVHLESMTAGIVQNDNLKWEDKMSLRQFGFQKDDEHFFKDAFDPLTRGSLMIELLRIRKRRMIDYYVMFTFGTLSGLMGLVSAKPYLLLGTAVWLFLSLMFLAFSLHADAKYKLVKAVEAIEDGRNGEAGR